MTLSSEAMAKQTQLFHHYNVEKVPASGLAKANQFVKSKDGDPVMIFDFGTLHQQWLQWKEFFPRVTPFYAVKCNCYKPLLEMLASLGGHFDCASKSEVDLVTQLKVPPTNIIYANPVKQPGHMYHATNHGVKLTTFDNDNELDKIKKCWPEAEVVLRIASENTNAQCELSSKFGCTMEEVPPLIEKCKRLNLNLVGVSFHVGSGCPDPQAWVWELHRAHEVMMEAKAQGFDLQLLDIGGGFPGDDNALFQHQAKVIAPVIDELFPSNIRVIAEPGRYFACAAFTLCCNVFGKRTFGDEPKEYQYYLNDGVYQSFNCLFFDHASVTPQVLKLDSGEEAGQIASSETKLTTLFGPTCDALDCISKQIQLEEMDVGDWVVFENMGAYTMSAASSFNGFSSWELRYCNSADETC
eukprot:NODE_115_length_1496_cov_961.031410_g113_i0.p1 GENE.NODE_115_length_1496_cov_961.031410_g113_i0~~NODE_115_length_1496_cov_961.031410_g113_i0.p1  ORF type:complete len:411 (+),score=72.49 NODE_115_length_1496_cov_961.031410_g113_i0:79-1311(+)